MYAVVRRYKAGSEVIDEVVRKRADVEQLISGVPGFIAYYVVRTSDGGATITICEDQAGTQESIRRAADWVRQNVPAASTPPEITEGEVPLHFGR
jgi:heme-degrading monooxygenase HmoA